MNEKNIAQLEARLEQLVEGTFANLFRKRISAHDVAVQLARSMENGLRVVKDGDARPIAPDRYSIHIHPQTQAHLQKIWEALNAALNQQMIELATQSGYRLLQNPDIRLIADKQVSLTDVVVRARHTKTVDSGTQAMQPIPLEAPARVPANPQLIISDDRAITLSTQPLFNIGRSDDNHIVIDDPAVSRHHVQVRLRFGFYTLFDVNSRGGTFVNNIRVNEHRLQSGDVIRIGDTQMLYLTEDDGDGASPLTTQSLEPIRP